MDTLLLYASLWWGVCAALMLFYYATADHHDAT